MVLIKKAIALIIKDKEDVKTIIKKKVKVMAVIKAEAIENSER